MAKVVKPAPFNKVETIQRMANVEVLPLNSSFVCRMMFVKNNIETAIKTGCKKDKDFALNSASLFFNDLYEAISSTEEDIQ